MTKLEEEILLAIDPLLKNLPSGVKAVEDMGEANEYYVMTKAIAEVAKRYIEEAIDEGFYFALKQSPPLTREQKDKWLKENGIV